MVENKLQWKNLLEKRCPACEEELEEKGEFLHCVFCTFRIGQDRAEEIIQSILEPRETN